MDILSCKRIRLSISILISDRPDTVLKCLKSLDSLRRKVPTELILVDTGCGEQVRKLVEPFADEVVEFPWCNDFSKARNAGLKRAKGEWFLYLDDDEWFGDTDALEDFFLSDKYLHYNYGSYLQRNYSDQEGRNYSDAYVGRLIRLEPGVEFMYAVHEVFSKVRMPWIRLHCYVHHYGYVFKSEEEARKHSKRNIELLLAEHEKEPGELRHIAQLVQEYNILEEWEKSIDISWEGIRNAKCGISTTQFLGGLYANLTRNYVVLKRYESAIEIAEKYLALEDSDELDRAAVYSQLCIAYLEKGEYAESINAAERYLDFYKRWEKNRDATALYESLALPFFSEGCRQNILCVVVQGGAQLRDGALAKCFFEQINWKEKNTLSGHRVQEMVLSLLRAWLCTAAGAARDYTAMIRVLLKDGLLAGVVEDGIDLLRKDFPDILQTKKADWASLAEENWWFRYFKLKNRIETDKDVLVEEYGKLWKEPLSALMKAGELKLWEMAWQDGVEMGQILSHIPLFRWERAVKTAVEELDWKVAQEMQKNLQEQLAPGSLHMLHWSIHYRMRKIWRLAEERDEREDNYVDQLEEIVKELLMYAVEYERLCHSLYREELFQKMPELLPLGCQVSMKLLDMAEAAKQGNRQQAVADVREASEIMPELSMVLTCCDRWLSINAEGEPKK